MQNIVLSLLVNTLMAALLLATMIYCWRLNTRIKLLQDSKSDLARIIHEFDESTKRATESIAEIHLATNRLSENIQHKIDKANYLADDLQYMIEKGNKLTGKVETAPVRPSRAPATPENLGAAGRGQSPAPKAGAAFILPDEPAERMAEPSAFQPRGSRMRSRAEQEIMSALSAKNNAGE